MFDQPLLQTKISLPQLPNKFIQRPRLTGRINQGLQCPLTLLAAPAGSGKTHLLIEWTKESRFPVAWLTVDSDDNDLSRFFRYFIGALQTIEPGLGEEALEFFQFTGGSKLEVGLTLLINELSALPKTAVLVLDDFHVVKNSVVLQKISFLIKYLPSNLRVVIASRSEPAVDLAFLRSKGRVLELDANDLRFTGEEVGQYFQEAIGLELPLETVQALEEHTDGWITALQMAAISLKDEAHPATLLANLQDRAYYVSDFLADEVLDRQPTEIRQFLLKSSILEILSGPLCEAVVKPDAQAGYGAVMLNRLEHANLFIMSLNGNHEWFRYHPVFADFLRQVQAEVNPAEIPELHKRAATWLEGNGNLNEAFRHALASRDLQWAADLIERKRHTMINTGEVSALTHWIGQLPDEIVQRRPYLNLTYAWALIATHQLDLARYWLDEARRSVEQLEKQTGETPTLDGPGSMRRYGKADLQYFHGSLAVSQSHLAILGGDMEQAAELSRQATRYLPQENLYLRSFLALDKSLSFVLAGDTQKAIESLRATAQIARHVNNLLAMIVAICQLADMQFLQGKISQAKATLLKAQYLAIGPEGKPLPLNGLMDIGFGEILLEHDLLEEARDHLERGCQVSGSTWYLGCLDGKLSMAHLRQAMGDISGVGEIMEEAARMALNTASSEWDDALVSAVAVRLALQRDDLAAAEQWWKKGGFPDLNAAMPLEDYPYHVFEYLLLTQARFLLARGRESGNGRDFKQASEMLSMLLSEAERFQRVTSQIQILILQAMAQFALGNERATKTLLRALALGEPEGYRRTYLDERWRLANLLRQCRTAQEESGSHFPSLAFIDSLLEALRQGAGAGPANEQPIEQKTGRINAYLEDGFPISLSAREIEILELIAAGKSNQEISAELYLALNTVKRHAYNIYTKLEVRKRTQAVSRARQLGLVA
jgi:LuxR family maltose regulon positive regulatory protein